MAHRRQEDAADLEMDMSALISRDKGISGFMNAVVRKCVVSAEPKDEPDPDGLPQMRIDRRLWFASNHCEGGNFSVISQRSEQFQNFLGSVRQAAQLANHEVHDIVGVAGGLNAVEIPTPAPSFMIEAKYCLIGERMNELQHEERVAGSLLMHQLSERRGVLKFATKRVGN